MSTLELYRELIPEHSAVLDAVVSRWLAFAIRRHDAESFGAVYADAMVFYAAHRVQRQPGSGAPGAPPAGAVGALVSQRDGDLSRTYAAPGGNVATTGSDAELQTTQYGLWYLDCRDSRAAAGPTLIVPGCV